jgi:hypothetical protein
MPLNSPPEHIPGFEYRATTGSGSRLEKRMEALQPVKLDGFQMVISELEVEQDYLRRAKRYLEE